jgi:hypothetical protein
MSTTNPHRLPTPARDEIRAAFLTDGLSIEDTGQNEWIEMQETVAYLIMTALDADRPADVTWASSDELADAVYALADEIVTRLDTAGKV